MKKGKYSLTISSDSLDVLKQFHGYCVDDLEQQCLIFDKDGEKCYYPEVDWDKKKKSPTLDITINCDFENEAE